MIGSPSALGWAGTTVARLAGGPGLDPEAPQAYEPLRVLMAERIARVVGGQPIVVEAHVTAPPDGEAPPRLATQPDFARDEFLACVDEGIERLLEGGEPQPVVHQLGVARLDASLLVVQVAFEGEILQIAMGGDQRQGTRALV